MTIKYKIDVNNVMITMGEIFKISFIFIFLEINKYTMYKNNINMIYFSLPPKSSTLANNTICLKRSEIEPNTKSEFCAIGLVSYPNKVFI